MELAADILGARDRPLIVISSIDGGGRYAFDPVHVARELGAQADVATIDTGDATRALERSLPAKTQVFGGAARSYPADFGAAPDWHRSLLRFPDRHTVDELIEDALAQVVAVVPPASSERPRWVRGVVELVSGATGNVARLDGGERVVVVGDRLPPQLPIAAALVEGGPVEGWLLGHDLAPEPAEIDPSQFTPGSTTLARVTKVTELRARLSLHPFLDDVVLRRRDVIPGADDGENRELKVSDLLTEGETVRVRVTAPSPELRLSLIGVDASAPLLPPPPLLRGGAPWLKEGVDAPVDDVDEGSDPAPREQHPVHAPSQPVAPAAVAAADDGLARELALLRDELTALKGAFARLGQEVRAATNLKSLDELRDEVTSLSAELNRERDRRRQRDERIAHLTQELREARTDRTPTEPAVRHTKRDEWPDADAWVRHEIRSAWALRTVAAEKQVHPLPDDFVVGGRFADSLETLDAAQFAKAMRAVVDALTGRAAEIPGRDLHRLRSGPGGDDPCVEREDGAKCWRASIEANAPAARRLHYWQLPGGRIELSRIVLHDDYRP